MNRPDKAPEGDHHITIRTISAAETRPLRQAVLRPHQRIEDLAYRPGDDAPDSRHFGAFAGGRLVGIASVYREAPAGEHCPRGAAESAPEGASWRLRGMAVVPEFRSAGVGGRLLDACFDYVEGNGGSYFWCNARTPAVQFYERHGLHPRGDIFDLPQIGPHLYMEKTLPGDR